MYTAEPPNAWITGLLQRAFRKEKYRAAGGKNAATRPGDPLVRLHVGRCSKSL